MGIFDKLFKAKAETKSFDQSAWDALVDLGARTASGVRVDPVTAMRCPAVNAGVRIRTETLSNLSLKLFRRSGDRKEAASDHPLFALIHGWANPMTSSATLVKHLEFDCITTGNGYALAVEAGGKVRELHRLEPGAVTVEYGDDLEPIYKVTRKSGGTDTFHWRRILHVQSLNGKSPIRECADSVGLSLALQGHASRLMSSAARPGGCLTSPKKLDDVALKRLTTSWRGAHSGNNSGGTAVLEDGVTFTPISWSSVDLEFSAMRAFQTIEIGRCLGVPPNLLFDFTRQTFSNSEDASQSYLSHTILGRCTEWQDAIGRLLSDDDRKVYFAEFSTDALVKADIAQRYSAYAQAIASRILCPNEVRSFENLAPYDGGDEFLNPNVTAQIPPPIQRRQPPKEPS